MLIKEVSKDHAERRKLYKNISDVRKYLDKQTKQKEVELQKRKEHEEQKVSLC